MKEVSRRSFLQTAGRGFSATGLAVALQSTAKAAPSERVRHAVIGTGGQGSHHVKTFASFRDCEVVAVCDVDPVRRAKAAASLPTPDKVKQTENFREILDDSSIDSVSVVTPDHWHSWIAIAALTAGKHVYVEKPCCHNINEGVLLEKAVRQSGKCVQHGTQGRTIEGVRKGIQFLRDGQLGKVRMAKVINHQ